MCIKRASFLSCNKVILCWYNPNTCTYRKTQNQAVQSYNQEQPPSYFHKLLQREMLFFLFFCLNPNTMRMGNATNQMCLIGATQSRVTHMSCQATQSGGGTPPAVAKQK